MLLKPKELTDLVLSELITDLSGFNNSIGKALDTVTDDECNPIDNINSEFITKIQDIAYNISKRVEEIEEDKAMLKEEFKIKE